MAATGNEYVKLSQLKGTVDAVKDKIDSVEGNIPAVVDNTTSTSTEDALSANQGKILQGQIDNLKNIGRFLAIWDATTGVPTSEPEESPYAYRTGDYFRIGVAGNRIPTGSQYIIGGTNYTTTTDILSNGDVYYYDGTSWNRQESSGGGTVQDVQVDGTSVLSGGIANIDLSGKADDSSVVHKSGNETIAGTKSFTNGIATDNINSVGTRVYFGSRVQQLEFQNSNLVKSADVGYGVACAFKTKALMSNTTYTEKLAYRTSTSTGNGKVFNIPTSKADGTYTLATTDDLPTKTSDLTNDSGFLTQHQDISGKMDKSGGTFTGAVDSSYGAIKSFRCSHKGFTNYADWYFPVAKLPKDDAGNYASAIVNGRIGGWTAGNMSQFSALAWQRGNYSGTQGSVIGWIIPANTKDSALNIADLVLYYQSDLSAILYVKCNGYYTFDFEVSLYQSSCVKLFDGTYVTTPSGTLSPNGTFKNNAKNLLESSSATWGGISGTLSNQTDLQNALNAKQDAITSTNKLSYSLLEDTPTIPTMPHLYHHGVTCNIKSSGTINSGGTIYFDFYDTNATALTTTSAIGLRVKMVSVTGKIRNTVSNKTMRPVYIDSSSASINLYYYDESLVLGSLLSINIKNTSSDVYIASINDNVDQIF